jgi:hypothetical protein
MVREKQRVRFMKRRKVMVGGLRDCKEPEAKAVENVDLILCQLGLRRVSDGGSREVKFIQMTSA